jgi:hypothetical protein
MEEAQWLLDSWKCGGVEGRLGNGLELGDFKKISLGVESLGAHDFFWHWFERRSQAKNTILAQNVI